MHIADAWWAMMRSVRNLGHPGVASMAIAAVDTALWDVKARLLDLPLVSLLGRVRTAVPVYGSGGFTSLFDRSGWKSSWVGGSGRHFTRQNESRPSTGSGSSPGGGCAKTIGEEAQLFVDANGGYAGNRHCSCPKALPRPGSSGSKSRSRRTIRRAALTSSIGSAADPGDGRGIRIRSLYFRRPAGGGGRRCAASGCSRCRGHHGIPQSRVALRGAPCPTFGSLRPVAPCASRLCVDAGVPHRILL